jgi:aminoglycoside/choline kinase family phosphotransferase
VDALHHLHRQDAASSGIPPYSHEVLMRELTIWADWYAPFALGSGAEAQSAAEEFLALWKELIQTLPPFPPVVVLRDYHADNLFWLPSRNGTDRVGLLDFQDAVVGSPAYDLVSLLQDARRDVPGELEEALLDYYVRGMSTASGDFRTAYELLGAQRNCKILGIFVRLARRDGKEMYLNFLPRVRGYLRRNLAHPALAGLRAWYERVIPESFR